MDKRVDIIGAGLAGSEAALQLADRGFSVRIFEMRPMKMTGAHRSDLCAELVCSNSLKALKKASAAGMLKSEMKAMGSRLLQIAFKTAIPAGGALAVDRENFSSLVTRALVQSGVKRVCAEVLEINGEGNLVVRTRPDQQGQCVEDTAPFIIIASGPLTSSALAQSLVEQSGEDNLFFYDAAAPIVYADSLDRSIIFRQSRYEEGGGDYLNAPFSQEEYDAFIEALLQAECVIKKDFETKDLFQACQPIEEIARKGHDALRFGPLKPVGLRDPRTGKRPWAVVQLRSEQSQEVCFNLVGFQTNLTFPEQRRVFRMIPGFEQAEFARYGVMHRNTFLNAPHLLTPFLEFRNDSFSFCDKRVFVAGQLSGTEGYCEAIAIGLWVSLAISAYANSQELTPMPIQTALGSLLDYASSTQTLDYQPMHVNFGLLPPLDPPIKNKALRYEKYALRGEEALKAYCELLGEQGLLDRMENSKEDGNGDI